MEDIITRGVGELRKKAFGDDADDAKDLPWTRTQAWGLMKQLAKEGEVRSSFFCHFFNLPIRPDCQLQISYHSTLINFPFKGDEMALRNMEHSELITITTHNGRPSTIRPGKPVYKFVFERVVGGPFIFSITYREFGRTEFICQTRYSAPCRTLITTNN